VAKHRASEFESAKGIYDRRLRRTDPCRMLFSAIEESRSWELVADLSPGGRFDASRVGRARRVLHAFSARGWILAYRTADDLSMERPVPTAELLALLVDDDSWIFDRSADPSLWIGATEEGEAALWAHWHRRPLHAVGFQFG
jgi:hypothetical protein